MQLCYFVTMCIFDNATIWHITPGLLSLVRRSVREGASLSITVIAAESNIEGKKGRSQFSLPKWDNLWTSRGGSQVNLYPRARLKAEGKSQGPSIYPEGTNSPGYPLGFSTDC